MSKHFDREDKFFTAPSVSASSCQQRTSYSYHDLDVLFHHRIGSLPLVRLGDRVRVFFGDQHQRAFFVPFPKKVSIPFHINKMKEKEQKYIISRGLLYRHIYI